MSRQILADGMYAADREMDHLHEVARIETDDFDFETLRKLQRRAYLKFFLTRFRFIRMLPKLFSTRSSKKYLKAIERNFMPRFLSGDASRVN
jgi:hypothetical protein